MGQNRQQLDTPHYKKGLWHVGREWRVQSQALEKAQDLTPEHQTLHPPTHPKTGSSWLRWGNKKYRSWGGRVSQWTKHCLHRLCTRTSPKMVCIFFLNWLPMSVTQVLIWFLFLQYMVQTFLACSIRFKPFIKETIQKRKIDGRKRTICLSSLPNFLYFIFLFWVYFMHFLSEYGFMVVPSMFK